MLETFTDSPALADAAADEVVRRLQAGLDMRGRATLVATGGRSPGPVYDRLSRSALDWARVMVTLSDERCVAPDAPQSNARLLRERLFRDGAARASFVSLWGDGLDPMAAARGVEAAIEAMTPFDLTLLGMGEDGHVASLIPGMPGLTALMDPGGARLVDVAPAGWGSPPTARVTLTLAALLRSRAILLLVAGDAKRRVIDAALAGADLPVRAVLAQDRVPVRVLWAPEHEH
jgi:6-phosphogluconolactonase